MGMDCSGLSVADAIALRDDNGRNNDGMFGGGWEWMMFLFFLLAWGNNGWGGFGNNGGAAGGALTRGELCQDMNFQSLENATRGIQQGLCDGFYAMNTGMLNGFSGVQNTLCQGFNGVNTQIANSTAGIQQGMNAINIAQMQNANALQAQLSDCCCENRAAIAQVRYDMAQGNCALQNTIQNTTRDIIDNQNAGTRAILDYLCKDKIDTLQSENQALRLAASQANQNSVLKAAMDANTAEIIRRTGNDCPIPAYVVPNPNCCYGTPYGVLNNGYGYNNGCGCNNSCC